VTPTGWSRSDWRSWTAASKTPSERGYPRFQGRCPGKPPPPDPAPHSFFHPRFHSQIIAIGCLRFGPVSPRTEIVQRRFMRLKWPRRNAHTPYEGARHRRRPKLGQPFAAWRRCGLPPQPRSRALLGSLASSQPLAPPCPFSADFAWACPACHRPFRRPDQAAQLVPGCQLTK
jgi:hypothetical protein